MLNYAWWQTGVIYQIFPASFADSDHDGFGDIRGVITKLDYLSWLGIDAIWLSPVFGSPLFDMGYDVTDYKKIHQKLGHLDDFKELLAKAHDRGIRIILDMVLNHTSVIHPWFEESRSSIDNPRRDWYIWHKESNRGRPNNWKSLYGGSAWEYDRATGQYYYHSFFREQPDLNWRNPEVRQQFYEIIRFWLSLGVDGFRLDAINLIVKDKEFKNSSTPFLLHLFGRENYVTRNQEESYDIIEEIRKIADQFPGTMLVGEIYTLPPGNPSLVSSYLSDKRQLLHLAFDFSLIFSAWRAKSYFRRIDKWLKCVPKEGWPSHVLSNHDLDRSLGMRRNRRFTDEKAKVMATLLLTLKGTPFIYYGEEIAMKNLRIPRKNISDPLGKKYWPWYEGRDPARTPMQWDSTRFAGFSSKEPWLPLHPEARVRNVLNQMEDEQSVLSHYRIILALRRSLISLQQGDWIPLINGQSDILAYIRSISGEKTLVILNFSRFRKTIRNDVHLDAYVLFSTHRPVLEKISTRDLKLFPFESMVCLIDKDYSPAS